MYKIKKRYKTRIDVLIDKNGGYPIKINKMQCIGQKNSDLNTIQIAIVCTTFGTLMLCDSVVS